MTVPINTIKPNEEIKTPPYGLDVIKSYPIRYLLWIIGIVQVVSGVHGLHQVYKYDENTIYHPYFFCHSLTRVIGSYPEYLLEIILGILLLMALRVQSLKRTFYMLRSWIHINWVLLTISIITFTCAYHEGNIRTYLFLNTIVCSSLHVVEIAVATSYYNFIRENNILALKFIISQHQLNEKEKTTTTQTEIVKVIQNSKPVVETETSKEIEGSQETLKEVICISKVD